MQNLGTILAALYPNAVTLVDYRVQDDGQGPYIAHWDEIKLGPKPTDVVLANFDIAKELHNLDIDRQIVALETTNPGYVRGIREFMLGIADAAKLGGLGDMTQTPGMKKVKQLDDAVKALRIQRK